MEKLIEQLRTILGTNFGLYFKIHSYHWNVEGPNFVEYHTYLGQLYTQIFNNTDLIAEKLRMLGTYAPVSLTRMKEFSDIEEDVSVLEANQMFQNLVIANDTGPAHMAAHLGARGFTLFGPHTTPEKVSIEREKFIALQTMDLKSLFADRVYALIKSSITN